MVVKCQGLTVFAEARAGGHIQLYGFAQRSRISRHCERSEASPLLTLQRTSCSDKIKAFRARTFNVVLLLQLGWFASLRS